jgi:hypothetical protein
MGATTYTLPAGYTITATAGSTTAHIRDVVDQTVGAVLTSGNSATFGPYLSPRLFSASESATVATAEHADALAALLLSGAGAPDDAVRATAGVNPTGDDNALTFTARAYGASGNGITIAYVDPGAISQSLAVSVNDQNVTVSLATNGGGTITSTAADVLAAINASGPASALMTVAINTADTGTGDDGSGVVTAMARAAFTSGAGTGIGRIKPGGLYIDTENGNVYRNSGTLAAPAWTQLADVA